MSLTPQYALRRPFNRVTQATNRLIGRAMMGLFPVWGPLIAGVCLGVGILLMACGFPIAGFLVIVAPYGGLIALLFAWLLIANYLVLLFGAHDSGRQSAMMTLTMFVMPTVLGMAWYDTLPFQMLSPSAFGYMAAGITLGIVAFGAWGVLRVGSRRPARIGLMAHAINAVLVLSLLEATLPYPETTIPDAHTMNCQRVEATSKTGVTTRFPVCRVRFTQDDKTRELWLTPDGDAGVRVRHGLFDHYR